MYSIQEVITMKQHFSLSNTAYFGDKIKLYMFLKLSRPHTEYITEQRSVHYTVDMLQRAIVE